MLTELDDLHAACVLTYAEFEAKIVMILGSTQAGSNEPGPVSERLD